MKTTIFTCDHCGKKITAKEDHDYGVDCGMFSVFCPRNKKGNSIHAHATLCSSMCLISFAEKLNWNLE